MTIYKNISYKLFQNDNDYYFVKQYSDDIYSYGLVICRPLNEWKVSLGKFYNSDLSDNVHFSLLGDIDLDKAIIEAVLINIREKMENENL